RKKNGKVYGTASANALVNLVESGVLTQEWVNNYLKSSQDISHKNKKNKTNNNNEKSVTSISNNDDLKSSSIPSS
ncbi:MAG: hypothetical protein R3321_07005, partial [Nitrososphaeraceae archaeon]|nr:hypothetical protein [Nitrososphaeraceae archaeon]